VLVTELLAATLVVLFASVIQGVSGVGGGFIMVPILAIIDIRFVPGPMIFATLFLSTPMAWQERTQIDYQNFWPIVIAAAPGTVLGAWLLSGIPADQLGLVFGAMILLAVSVTSLGLKLPLNRLSGGLAGLIAGTMGASSGIGAPAIAVLYQDQSAPVIRATLALIYTLASLLIVIVLAAFGRFGLYELTTGLQLVPGMVLGYVLSRSLAAHAAGTGIRYLVLLVSAAAAVTLIIMSL